MAGRRAQKGGKRGKGEGEKRRPHRLLECFFLSGSSSRSLLSRRLSLYSLSPPRSLSRFSRPFPFASSSPPPLSSSLLRSFLRSLLLCQSIMLVPLNIAPMVLFFESFELFPFSRFEDDSPSRRRCRRSRSDSGSLPFLLLDDGPGSFNPRGGETVRMWGRGGGETVRMCGWIEGGGGGWREEEAGSSSASGLRCTTLYLLTV